MVYFSLHSLFFLLHNCASIIWLEGDVLVVFVSQFKNEVPGPWAGLIPLAISFILVQHVIWLGPVVLFSIYAFSSVSLGLCRGYHAYVQAND